MLIVEGVFLPCLLNLEAQMMNNKGQVMGRDLANSKLIHTSEVTLKPGKKNYYAHPYKAPKRK